MQVGIKETEDVIVALQEVSVALVVAVKRFGLKDGALAFVEALLGDVQLQEKLVAAYENIALVPAEVVDISIIEGLTLGKDAFAFQKAIVAALKTEPEIKEIA
jgi:hypothetical protein